MLLSVLCVVCVYICVCVMFKGDRTDSHMNFHANFLHFHDFHKPNCNLALSQLQLLFHGSNEFIQFT